MTPEEKTKYVCEEVGIKWHKEVDTTGRPLYLCSCGFKTNFYNYGARLEYERHIKESNLNFTTDHGRAELLRIMKKDRDTWSNFLWSNFLVFTKVKKVLLNFINYDFDLFMGYITEPEGGTMLLDAVYDYFKEREDEGKNKSNK